MRISYAIKYKEYIDFRPKIGKPKIRLNICPSSNYKLGAVQDMSKYPARKLFNKGIILTINTDDLLLFDS